MSANKWLQIITDKRLSKCDVVPKEYKTRQEIEKIWKVCKASAANRLRDLKKAGLIEEKKFIIKTNRGEFPTAHYKIK